MNDIRDLIKEFREEDVKTNIREILKVLGIEDLLKLSKKWGGGHIYLPTQECILRESRDRLILKGFNGKNYGELAREFHMSETNVRKIIKNKK
ncbi:Mor transcription activator family protein [Metaclostridioides mangenotii]|uniref:Mor family transcriptional regulator n=1 Tax=Metaclostridioides mangenotii TaxID=1540 RepID=A0ABS4EBF9_9FIRM|nr:Mor transcription activator family protein [Clostridioides mangenotii]MBP1855286.1 Mor family transcriptional regulator [Clostridioides mangenotii]